MEKLIQELAAKSGVDEDAARKVLDLLGSKAVEEKLSGTLSANRIDSIALGDLKLAVRITAQDAIS